MKKPESKKAVNNESNAKSEATAHLTYLLFTRNGKNASVRDVNSVNGLVDCLIKCAKE